MMHLPSRAATCLAVLLAAASPALANPATTLSFDAAAAEIGGARVNGLAMTLEGRYSSGFH